MSDGEPFQDKLEVIWVETEIHIAIHELRHYYQFKTSPLKYFICLIPFVRNLTIEKDAERVAESSEKPLEDKINEEVFLAFAASMAKKQ